MDSYLIRVFFFLLLLADMEINQQNDLCSTVLEILSSSSQLTQVGSVVQALSGSAFNMQKAIFCHCV